MTAGAGAGVEPDLEFLLEPEWSRLKIFTASRCSKVSDVDSISYSQLGR